MLILTRRIGETIRIGNEIEVVVMDASGIAVRIGIEAPRSLPVHREEVYARVHSHPEPDPTAARNFP